MDRSGIGFLMRNGMGGEMQAAFGRDEVVSGQGVGGAGMSEPVVVVEQSAEVEGEANVSGDSAEDQENEVVPTPRVPSTQEQQGKMCGPIHRQHLIQSPPETIMKIAKVRDIHWSYHKTLPHT